MNIKAFRTNGLCSLLNRHFVATTKFRDCGRIFFLFFLGDICSYVHENHQGKPSQPVDWIGDLFDQQLAGVWFFWSTVESLLYFARCGVFFIFALLTAEVTALWTVFRWLDEAD